MIGGPMGGVIGATLGLLLSFHLLGLSFKDIQGTLAEFFDDFSKYADLRFQSVHRIFQEGIDNLKRWWNSLSFGNFHLTLPHIQVSWEMLDPNSVLARFFSVTAIPHLSVAWYARGGIVDGATLIGAGEAGKEAIIPLEKHTEWIRMVATELKQQLETVTREKEAILWPAAASSSLVPPAALQSESRPIPDGLKDAIVSSVTAALTAGGSGPVQSQQPIQLRVYLDGRQLSDAVTRYQRMDARAYG